MDIIDSLIAIRWLTSELANLAKHGDARPTQIAGLVELIDRRVDIINDILDRQNGR